ncbi:MAG: hypothetical protein AB1721_02195 [Patescibacteria group bacterium]
MEILIEIIGWVGSGLIIFAYYLLQTDKIEETNKKYQLLNIFGALFVGLNAFSKNAWPIVFLQLIWILIALKALTKNKIKPKQALSC